MFLKHQHRSPDKSIAVVLLEVFLIATFIFGTACQGGTPPKVAPVPTVPVPTVKLIPTVEVPSLAPVNTPAKTPTANTKVAKSTAEMFNPRQTSTTSRANTPRTSETPNAETTLQASIASIRAAQTNPLDPKAKKLVALVESMSDEEEFDCLMEGQLLRTHNTYQCLDDESGYRLYRHDAVGIYMTELREETHRCIWAGIRPLLTLNEGQVKEFEAKARETYEEVVLPQYLSMELLCMNGSELESKLITYDDDALEEIAYRRCVMEAHGGPSEYTKASMYSLNGDAEFEEFKIKGWQACGLGHWEREKLAETE